MPPVPYHNVQKIFPQEKRAWAWGFMTAWSSLSCRHQQNYLASWCFFVQEQEEGEINSIGRVWSLTRTENTILATLWKLLLEDGRKVGHFWSSTTIWGKQVNPHVAAQRFSVWASKFLIMMRSQILLRSPKITLSCSYKRENSQHWVYHVYVNQMHHSSHK